MGCYDTVLFTCPRCEEVIQVQTKAGRCDLMHYRSKEVPIGIATAIEGSGVSCPSCAEYFNIVSELPEYVKLKLV